MGLSINNGTGKKSPLGDLGVVFHSNGKLLITAEYLVLKGASAMAVPLNLGQDLHVEENGSGFIDWVSTVKGEHWLNARISLSGIDVVQSNDDKLAEKLAGILRMAKGLNPSFLNGPKGYTVNANIEFDLEWGLGSSSTLISNIAWWAGCDPYRLNSMAFKGSGYDIACARSNSPIIYRLNEESPFVEKVDFKPSFLQQISLVWLNQKQNSRDEIGRFDHLQNYYPEIDEINNITAEMLNCDDIRLFMYLMEQHENIISSVIKTPKVKDRLFSGFDGAIKSLGAWGGDFVMVATLNSFEYVQKYFNQKGFYTVVSFQSMVKV
jgi:mevalonate kinase